MRFNKEAVQRELDLAAEEMERHGYVDLANKIDQYASLIMKADEGLDLQEIRRGLERVERESSRRKANFVEKDEKEVIAAKRQLIQKKLAKLREERKQAVRKDIEKKQAPNARSEKLAKLIEKARARKHEKTLASRVEDLKLRVRKRRLARKRREQLKK